MVDIDNMMYDSRATIGGQNEILTALGATDVDVNDQRPAIRGLQHEIAQLIEDGGTGEGTTNYEKLKNQPQINDVTLIGNKTGKELGLTYDVVEVSDVSNLTMTPNKAYIATVNPTEINLTLEEPKDLTIENSYSLKFTSSNSWAGKDITVKAWNSNYTVVFDKSFPTIASNLRYELVVTLYNATTIVVYGKCIDEALSVDGQKVKEFSTAQTTWSFAHNLDSYPTVTCLDENNKQIFGQVEYQDKNIVNVYFTTATKGKMVIN